MAFKGKFGQFALILAFLLVSGQSCPAEPPERVLPKEWSELDAALRRNPKDVYLWINRGHFYMDAYEDQNALQCFSKAIELDPNDTTALIYRSQCYGHMGNTKSSMDDIDKACELMGKNQNAKASNFVLGAVADRYHTKGKLNDELKVRSRITANSTNINDLKRKINCEIQLKMYAEAQKDLIAALAKKSDDPEYNDLLGDCYKQTGRTKDAVLCYTRAINGFKKKDIDLIDKKHFQTLQKRLECNQLIGDKKAILEDKKLIDNAQSLMFDMAPFR